MLELVFALKNDWTEILELADSLLVFLLRSLQVHDKYAKLTTAAQRLYPAAGSFKLGLDKNGKLPRVRFDEAKAILRNQLGRKAHVEEDLTYVHVLIMTNHAKVLNILNNAMNDSGERKRHCWESFLPASSHLWTQPRMYS